jgi:uncharacterized glyoxalase superfamily protein PhnB
MSNDAIEFHFCNPVMAVKDVKATAKFYKEALGFDVNIIWENPSYGCVSRGGITIEFGEGRPNHVGGSACVLQVSDVDSLYSEFKSRGVNFVGDFSERDYGSKDFRISDHDGNILVFGGALANKEELIAKGNVA